MPEPDRQSARWPIHCATAGGLGLLKPAPGTCGSLGGLALGLGWVAIAPAGWTTPGLWLLVAVACLVGVPAATMAGSHFRRQDPPQVVVDEVAGQLLTLALLPGAVLVDSLLLASILAFLAFRLFDIIKPWPIAVLERLPRGWGVMADDLAAGLAAGMLTTALLS